MHTDNSTTVSESQISVFLLNDHKYMYKEWQKKGLNKLFYYTTTPHLFTHTIIMESVRRIYLL